MAATDAYWTIDSGLPSGYLKNVAGSSVVVDSIQASDIPNLDAGIIATGTFSTARIPSLPASILTSGSVAFARGGNSGTQAIPSTSGVMTIPMTTANVTGTPLGDCTFNGDSSGVDGQILTFILVSAGTTNRTMTFGTNISSTGTYGTGTVNNKIGTITFKFSSSRWVELCRSGPM